MEEVDIIAANVPKVGVGGIELEGATVLGELILHLVGVGVLADRNAVVCQCLGGLLNVRLKQHCHGGREARKRVDTGEENKKSGLVAR